MPRLAPVMRTVLSCMGLNLFAAGVTQSWIESYRALRARSSGRREFPPLTMAALRRKLCATKDFNTRGFIMKMIGLTGRARFGMTTAMGVALTAGAAQADVTPADVWADWQG